MGRNQDVPVPYALKANTIRMHAEFKHEEQYLAPSCKVFAFEAEGVLCYSGSKGEEGTPGGDLGDGDEDNSYE